MKTQDEDEELCLDDARSIAEGKSSEGEEIRTKKTVKGSNERERRLEDAHDKKQVAKIKKKIK
jgi:hypothetical protein